MLRVCVYCLFFSLLCCLTPVYLAIREYLLHSRLSTAETVEGKVHQRSLRGKYIRLRFKVTCSDCSRLNMHLQIYPDPELEQQILALPIRCIHSEEGCRWTGQMKQLQVSSLTLPQTPPPAPLHPRPLYNLSWSDRAPVAALPRLPMATPARHPGHVGECVCAACIMSSAQVGKRFDWWPTIGHKKLLSSGMSKT